MTLFLSILARTLQDTSRGQYLDPKSGSTVRRDNRYDIISASPPTQSNSASIHTDGTDFSYFTSVEFGSTGKTMYMLVDTGAANTWVMGADCTSSVCAQHNTFGPADSTSLVLSQDPFNLTYGTGSVSGWTANDTVKVAGFSIPLSFGLASTTSDDFSDYPMDGILGLGLPASKSIGSPTVMDMIQDVNILPSNLFGVNLQRSSDGSTDGELSFGTPDTTKYRGELSYTNTVADASMWEIPMNEVRVGGQPCNIAGNTAIIDTGVRITIEFASHSPCTPCLFRDRFF
ncbi:MAG: hypothetical protein Q9220_003961 [cf. Caloplaca sp. 1 TL-2023]